MPLTQIQAGMFAGNTITAADLSTGAPTWTSGGNLTITGNLITAAKGISRASLPAGSVLQIANNYLTSTSQLTSGGAIHELSTSLRITFTPISSSSTLYLECFGSFICPQSTNLQYAAFYDVTNATYVNLPPASGSRRQVHWINRTQAFDINDAAFMYFMVSVTNSTTTARTYTIYHSTEGITIQFLASTLSTTAGATYPLHFRIIEVAT